MSEIKKSKSCNENTFFPFSNGSQKYDWYHNNCWECTKYRANPQFTCRLEKSLVDNVTWGDGRIPMDIANQIGIVDNPYVGEIFGKCKQFNGKEPRIPPDKKVGGKIDKNTEPLFSEEK